MDGLFTRFNGLAVLAFVLGCAAIAATVGKSPMVGGGFGFVAGCLFAIVATTTRGYAGPNLFRFASILLSGTVISGAITAVARAAFAGSGVQGGTMATFVSSILGLMMLYAVVVLLNRR